jgi:hypothetical protein
MIDVHYSQRHGDAIDTERLELQAVIEPVASSINT